jgi:RNA polymerase sigma-70 factor (ECF subfamily)
MSAPESLDSRSGAPVHDPFSSRARDAVAPPAPPGSEDGAPEAVEAAPGWAAGRAGDGSPDDGALVRAAQAGDGAAFGVLYERHFDRIYGYLAYHLGDPDAAEDATGQVFLRALEALPRYRPTGAPVRAWLYRIAHNLVIDAHRRRHRRPETTLIDGHADGLVADGHADGRRLGDPAGWLAEKVAREALVAAVDDLTALQRQVILLKFAGGMSNAEVAAVLDRTEGAVKALQHAGLRSLQRRLAGSGVP